MTGRILINYRREDSLGSAGRLYDRLEDHFSRESVFMDVDAIEPGMDFVDVIERAISNCAVFIAVIGPDWVTVTDSEGNRRLDDPGDFVRIEIAAALDRDIRVIPVLVEMAAMPHIDDLPDDLKPLARRNAIEISHTRFDMDANRLISAIERVLEQMESNKKATESEKGRLVTEKAKADKIIAEEVELVRLASEKADQKQVELGKAEREKIVGGKKEIREKPRSKRPSVWVWIAGVGTLGVVVLGMIILGYVITNTAGWSGGNNITPESILIPEETIFLTETPYAGTHSESDDEIVVAPTFTTTSFPTLTQSPTNSIITNENASNLGEIKLLAEGLVEIFSVAWSPNGELVAALSKDNVRDEFFVYIWNIDDFGLIDKISSAQVDNIVWSPNSTKLGWGGWSGMWVWDVYSGRKSWESSDHVGKIDWSLIEEKIITYYDGKILSYDAETGEQEKKFGYYSRIEDIVWSPDGSMVASVGCDWKDDSTAKRVLDPPQNSKSLI